MIVLKTKLYLLGSDEELPPKYKVDLSSMFTDILFAEIPISEDNPN